MKKSLIAAFISSLIVFAIIYLIGCFFTADFNISHWPESARGFVGVFGLLSSVIAFVAALTEYEYL